MKQSERRDFLLLIRVAIFLDGAQFVQKVCQFIRGDRKVLFVVGVDSVAQSLHDIICPRLNRTSQRLSLVVFSSFILVLCGLRFLLCCVGSDVRGGTLEAELLVREQTLLLYDAVRGNIGAVGFHLGAHGENWGSGAVQGLFL